MDNHAKYITLNAQSNARAWAIYASDASEAGRVKDALTAQSNAAYWNALALSHLSAD